MKQQYRRAGELDVFNRRGLKGTDRSVLTRIISILFISLLILFLAMRLQCLTSIGAACLKDDKEMQRSW